MKKTKPPPTRPRGRPRATIDMGAAKGRIGERIRAARERAGLSVDQASERAGMPDYSPINIDLKAGKAVFEEGLQGRVNELKRAYSFQAVQTAARANGWTWQGQTKTAGKLVRAMR